METIPDSHLATIRNEFAPKYGELQQPMSDKSDRQATVDVISNQYSDTTSPTTIVSFALQPSICMSDGVNILNGIRATQFVGAQSTMSRPTLNKRDIANDVIFDSNLEWDQTLLDPNIGRLDEQSKGERPFDGVGILKSSKTILTLNEASEDETLDQLDDFNTAMDLTDTGIGNATLVSNLDWDQTFLDPNIGDLGRSVSADSTSHGLLLQLPEASMGSDSDALLPEQDETDKYPMDLENGEQQCVMSDKLAVVPATKRPPPTPQQEAKQHEFTFYGVKYRSVNKHNVIYSIQKASTCKHLVLIDGGANGGIAGDNARIIIAIIRQQAYIGKGQSILSNGQMEHFKIVLDDKSTKVGA
ncbi:unnamed protein product [Cylindrotheca closterium]|uniref:Uncharacterized protein n=1 Tax=Cylindrotheca closterium TaxID=2856 RepID=A0AAD2FDH6_9STRA|nr:unnamed protein product [Cylindrotheca closterium]